MAAEPFDDRLDTVFIGAGGEPCVQVHLPNLGLVHLVVDAPAPHCVAEGEDNVVFPQYGKDLIKAFDKWVSRIVAEHVGGGDRSAFRDDPHHTASVPGGIDYPPLDSVDHKRGDPFLCLTSYGGEDVIRCHLLDTDLGGGLIDWHRCYREGGGGKDRTPDRRDVPACGEICDGVCAMYFGDPGFFDLILGSNHGG
ncbi:MAG: hypothetical protein QMC91_06410 [Methanoculleus sp.]|nr:hypothetical protein [Methanoculleus sp.]MDI6867272.1 hypothetical protein [Methanoculleus sp.]